MAARTTKKPSNRKKPPIPRGGTRENPTVVVEQISENVGISEPRLEELFRRWQRRLRLDLWTIDVRVEPCRKRSSFMDVRKTSDYDAAIISVQPWVLTGEIPEGVIDFPLTEELIETFIVHELLHCIFRNVSYAVADRLDGLLHRDVYTVFTESYDHLEENAIDNLARALVRNWGK